MTMIKLLTFNGDYGFKQKPVNESMKVIGDRQAPDQMNHS